MASDCYILTSVWNELKFFSSCLQNVNSSSSSSHPESPTSPATPAVKKKRPEDFKFGKVLGEGSFSTVSSPVPIVVMSLTLSLPRSEI